VIHRTTYDRQAVKGLTIKRTKGKSGRHVIARLIFIISCFSISEINAVNELVSNCCDHEGDESYVRAIRSTCNKKP